MIRQAERKAPRTRRSVTAPGWWNQPVSWLLRSRLHRLLSNTLMLITVRGRLTGRFHTLPVGYVEAPGAIYVLIGDYETKQWWRNLDEGSPVALIVRRHVVDARATVLDRYVDRDEFTRAFALYRAKFRALRTAPSDVLMVRCALA